MTSRATPGIAARNTPNGTRAFAHAKINLVLRVLARETSGYHSIETLFQALELGDIVDVALSSADRTLVCQGPGMPAVGLGDARDNLATQAAVAYADATRWDTGWHISIDKHIPVGGGLGGGSADAAAVLQALESLSPHPMGLPALMELAGTLGADVPFLLSGAPLALAWNRGDRFLPLPPLARMDVTLVTFESGVNTGAAYGALATARDPRHSHALSLNPSQGVLTGKAAQYPADAFASWASITGLAANDFEPVVQHMHAGVAHWLPVVRSVAQRLLAAGVPAIGLMSGSGATCFVLAAPGMIPELGTAPGLTVVKTHTLAAVSSF